MISDEFLEPELRPEFVKKMKKLEKQKAIPFKSLEELRKSIDGSE